MRTYTIGKVIKSRGLKGELKVQITTNKLEAFRGLAKVWLDDEEYEVEKSSIQNKFAYIQIKGVCDINRAEDFRGMKVGVSRDALKLKNDEFLTEELIGATIVDEGGNELGVIERMETYGAGEVIESGDLMIPYEDNFIVETNLVERKVVVRAKMIETEEVR